MSTELATELKKKRRYQCSTCHKGFSRPSALRTHIYTHTGEKPFECTTPGCGRRFAVISNLRRHFKVHRKVVHTNRIPASERLRHVQKLIERTSTGNMPNMPFVTMPDHHGSATHQGPDQYYRHYHYDSYGNLIAVAGNSTPSTTTTTTSSPIYHKPPPRSPFIMMDPRHQQVHPCEPVFHLEYPYTYVNHHGQQHPNQAR